VTTDNMDRLSWLRKTLEDADLELMREMLKVFAEELMGAKADAVCGAGFRERSDECVNRRNGYRERDLDTRVGTIALAVPKLREGSYYPDWLLENRRRAERALVAVIAECYVRGVSTRRVDGLVKTLGIEGISRSQVSRMAKTLDEEVAAFRSRPLDGESYPYLWVDALAIRVREGRRVVKVACIVATAVNGEGQREIVGLDTFT
jgi:putative transposase